MMNSLIKDYLFAGVLFASCASDHGSASQAPPVIEGDEPIAATLLPRRFTQAIRSILEDSQGNFWFGNHGEGVARYDGDTIVYFTTKDGLSNNQVRSIKEDGDGNMWFGDRDTGAWRFDGQSFQNFTIKDGLKSPHVWAIYRDSRDDLWFALENGSVCKFNGSSFDVVFTPAASPPDGSNPGLGERFTPLCVSESHRRGELPKFKEGIGEPPPAKLLK